MEFIIIVAVLVCALLIFIFWQRKRSRISHKDLAFIMREWKNILLLAQNRQYGYVLVQADKLFEYILKRKGINGSFKDKMTRAKVLLSHIDDVWTAHKLRNRVAHEPGFIPTEKEALFALRTYKRALGELENRLSLTVPI